MPVRICASERLSISLVHMHGYHGPQRGWRNVGCVGWGAVVAIKLFEATVTNGGLPNTGHMRTHFVLKEHTFREQYLAFFLDFLLQRLH